MTEIISAEGARKLTMFKLLTLEDMMSKIKTNANLGFYRVTLDSTLEKLPEDVADQLLGLGYTIERSTDSKLNRELYCTVRWSE